MHVRINNQYFSSPGFSIKFSKFLLIINNMVTDATMRQGTSNIDRKHCLLAYTLHQLTDI